ncbi:MAG: hypothetical protein KGS61_21450 [Verrucomicrobia bacterium]|nr:hypothetical protein [Verrucomicrobiota bacterium]
MIIKLFAKPLFLGALGAAQIAWGQDVLATWTTNSLPTATGNTVILGPVAFGSGRFVVGGNVTDV